MFKRVNIGNVWKYSRLEIRNRWGLQNQRCAKFAMSHKAKTWFLPIDQAQTQLRLDGCLVMFGAFSTLVDDNGKTSEMEKKPGTSDPWFAEWCIIILYFLITPQVDFDRSQMISKNIQISLIVPPVPPDWWKTQGLVLLKPCASKRAATLAPLWGLQLLSGKLKLLSQLHYLGMTLKTRPQNNHNHNDKN